MRQCPTCKKPTIQEFVPFCSKRCKDVDLGRWFNESYTVPVQEYDEDMLAEIEAIQDSDSQN